MSFQDLLNQPLPSQRDNADVKFENTNSDDISIEDYIKEMEDDLFNDEDDADDDEKLIDTTDESDKVVKKEIVKNSDDNDDHDEHGDDDHKDDSDDDKDDDDELGDDFDIDDLSDEELAALDAELSDGELDDVADDEGLDEAELTPDEEQEADDMMQVAATTMLVNDELNAEEKAEFLNSQQDVMAAVNEGFLSESDVNVMAYEAGLVKEAVIPKNKMIIHLDVASKKKQLYAIAVNVSAAAHNDKDYIKLRKVMKMRKILRARLEKKYKTEATKRMRVYYKRLMKSKSPVLAKLGAKKAGK